MPLRKPVKGDPTDPEFRRERARKAGQAAHSLDVYVRRIVDRAPELNDEQKTALAVLLRPEAEGAAS